MDLGPKNGQTNRVSNILGPDGRPWELPYDDYAVPHVLTFQALLSAGYRTYYHDRHDEALRDSRDNAIAMRNDPYLMSLLDERIEATASLKWHLECDDEEDAYQVDVADALTKIVQRVPRLKRMIRNLLQGIWFGKYGIQCKYEWQDHYSGKRVLTVAKHEGVNGDKIGHLWDGTPYVLVNPSYATEQNFPNAEWVYTTAGGRGLVLKGSWKDRFILHYHAPDDMDYFSQTDMGEARFGVGIRSRLYWLNWMKMEYLSFVVEYMERVGMGLTLWYYDLGNPAMRTEVEKEARNQTRRTNIILPRLPGNQGRGSPGVDRIETPTAGSEVLLVLIEHIEKQAERYVVGQSASGDSETSGMGTHDTGFQQDTKFKKIQGDAEELAETLTGSEHQPGLVSIHKKWNFPDAKFPVRWVFELERPDGAGKLEMTKTFVDMGGEVIESEARAMIGLSEPSEGDKTIGGKEAMFAANGLGPDGKPGEKPSPFGEKPGEGAEQKPNEQAGKGDAHEQVKFLKVGDVQRYAEEGEWITIGGHPEDGEKHVGGFHIKVDAQGNIIEGPKWLKDKGVTNLKGAHGHQLPEGEEEENANLPAKKEEPQRDANGVIIKSGAEAHGEGWGIGKSISEEESKKQAEDISKLREFHRAAEEAIKAGKPPLQALAGYLGALGTQSEKKNEPKQIEKKITGGGGSGGGSHGSKGIADLQDAVASLIRQENFGEKYIQRLVNRNKLTSDQEMEARSRLSIAESERNAKRAVESERQKNNHETFRAVNEYLDKNFGQPAISGKSSAAYYRTPDDFSVRVADHAPIYARSQAHVNVVVGGDAHQSWFNERTIVIDARDKKPEKVIEEIERGLANWREQVKKKGPPTGAVSRESHAPGEGLPQLDSPESGSKEEDITRETKSKPDSPARYTAEFEAAHPRAEAGKFTFTDHPYASDDEKIVHVNPAKIDADWQKDKTFHIPTEGQGESEVPGRRKGFEQFLDTGKPIESPRMELTTHRPGGVIFSDGRHRFAVLRDMGINPVPVHVPKEHAAEFEQRYGVQVADKFRKEGEPHFYAPVPYQPVTASEPPTFAILEEIRDALKGLQTPAINVAAPEVKVTVKPAEVPEPKPRKPLRFKIKRDNYGDIEEIVTEEIE